jgi:hypothetical protein
MRDIIQYENVRCRSVSYHTLLLEEIVTFRKSFGHTQLGWPHACTGVRTLSRLRYVRTPHDPTTTKNSSVKIAAYHDRF